MTNNTYTDTRSRSEQNVQQGQPPALQPSRLPISPSVAKEFDVKPAEWRVLVDQIFPAAKTVEAVMMALAYCRKRNLDIFKKPVHIVPMWSSAKKAMVETVWPGIAEIRTTASRTGDYAGIDEVEFGPMVEREFSGVQEVWEDRRKIETEVCKTVRFPEWAKVTVYRMNHGVRCAFTARVFWEEMYATAGKSGLPNDMWAKRPRGQLDKCVEAAALRKAFPEELGNTYSAEEMEGREFEGVTIDATAAKTPPVPPKPPAPPTINTAAHSDAVDGDGVVIDATVAEANEAAPADEYEGDDDTAFFERLEEDMAVANDAESIEEVWTNADPMARFDGKQNADTNQSIALAIRKRAEKRIREQGAK